VPAASFSNTPSIQQAPMPKIQISAGISSNTNRHKCCDGGQQRADGADQRVGIAAETCAMAAMNRLCRYSIYSLAVLRPVIDKKRGINCADGESPYARR